MMFKLALFFALSVAVFSASIRVKSEMQAITEMVKNCTDETGIKNETLQTLCEYLKEKSEVPPEFKCFFRCAHEKLQLQSPSGDYTPRKYMDVLQKSYTRPFDESKVEKALRLLDECENADVEDQCERSVKIGQCIEEKNVFQFLEPDECDKN